MSGRPELRGAIVGFGRIAEKGHFPAYLQMTRVSIEAVVEPSSARREAARTLRPSLRFYNRLEELLSAEALEFIDICTPPSSHAALALQALDRGVDVLCEKPLCLRAPDYRSLADAVSRSKRLLFPVHNWSFAPILSRALSLIRQGRIGRVRHVEIFVLRDSHCKGAGGAEAGGRHPPHEDWRLDPAAAGGGITLDHGWHAFYLLLQAIGREPRKLLAKMEGPPGGLEETARILVQFSEADGFIHLTWRAPERKNGLLIQGTEGAILVDDGRLMWTEEGGSQKTESYPPLSAGSHHPEWFPFVFQDFMAERNDPRQRGRTFGEAGWCVAMTEAAYASKAMESRPVPVAEPPRPVAV